MIDKKEIITIAETFLKTTECYLVDITVGVDNLIVVEIDSDGAVGIDDCASLSRHIEAKLDREAEDFELEVSSSGISSPFKTVRQYVKNIGNEIEMMLKNGAKLTGILASADENAAVITVAVKEKAAGAKRKAIVHEDRIYAYSEIIHTKNIIRFK
ncbi:MAG: ribosome assembly cofactor RimP [Tannerella sp.]|jgi:ribosome maturation factor RimP|nr:ribosome assembly cofactor RimP [Tannerella sp.]